VNSVYYELKSSIISNADVLLTSGRSQYWLFFYHEQLPAWKAIIFIFLNFFSG